MNLIKYPSDEAVNKAMAADESLLILISFDRKTAIMSQIDEAVEHHILLMDVGYKDTDTPIKIGVTKSMNQRRRG